MFSKTILTLASSFAMVLVAGSGQTLADPAPEFRLAGSHFPNFQIKPVVPRPPMVQPQVRVPVDKDRLKRESGQDQAPTVTAPPVVEPNAAGAPNRTSAPEFVGLPKPRLDPEDSVGDVADRLTRLAHLAEIKALKDHIAALEAMLNLSSLDGSSDVSGIGDWGAGAGEDGNQNRIPPVGGNNGGAPGTPDDTAGRRGPGAGPDHGDLGMDLLGRTSGALGTDKKFGPDLSPAAPGEALGGIASIEKQETQDGDSQQIVSTSPRETETNEDGGTTTTYTKTRANGNTIAVTEVDNSTSTQDPAVVQGRAVTERTADGRGVYHHSVQIGRHGSVGVQTIRNPLRRTPGFDRTQDPYSGGGVIAWVPPSCGSAECNAIRDFLKNPKGVIGQVMDKGSRVLGDRGADPGAGAGHRLTVDQHGLVVLYGPDSGPPAGGGGGRVQRFDPSKFRSD